MCTQAARLQLCVFPTVFCGLLCPSVSPDEDVCVAALVRPRGMEQTLLGCPGVTRFLSVGGCAQEMRSFPSGLFWRAVTPAHPAAGAQVPLPPFPRLWSRGAGRLPRHSCGQPAPPPQSGSSSFMMFAELGAPVCHGCLLPSICQSGPWAGVLPSRAEAEPAFRDRGAFSKRRRAVQLPRTGLAGVLFTGSVDGATSVPWGNPGTLGGMVLPAVHARGHCRSSREVFRPVIPFSVYNHP